MAGSAEMALSQELLAQAKLARELPKAPKVAKLDETFKQQIALENCSSFEDRSVVFRKVLGT